MDLVLIFFIVTAVLSLKLIDLTRKPKKISLVFAIGGLLGSIIGYAIKCIPIKYTPMIWEKPLDRPNVPTLEKLIIINFSWGDWLIVFIIVVIFLSIAQLYEEKQAMLHHQRKRPKRNAGGSSGSERYK
jgi:hypothetical protein